MYNHIAYSCWYYLDVHLIKAIFKKTVQEKHFVVKSVIIWDGRTLTPCNKNILPWRLWTFLVKHYLCNVIWVICVNENVSGSGSSSIRTQRTLPEDLLLNTIYVRTFFSYSAWFFQTVSLQFTFVNLFSYSAWFFSDCFVTIYVRSFFLPVQGFFRLFRYNLRA
jgi:hypothetical protein